MNLKLLARKLTTALLLLAMPFIVSAQQKTVNGKITSDKDGSPISGATVLAKGSKKGTQTAADGSFVLEVPAATTKLVISSVGFGTQELTIGADNTANLVLKASNEALTEVVVIGYGTARKKDLTGAVGSVSAKNFNKGPTASPELLIQGKTPGVQVVTNSGAPGGGVAIRIRGNGSLRAGNDPLFVVDGIVISTANNARPDINLTSDIGGSSPSGNPLNFINSADIASMEVLKDASAAAIYGSRAANGVVLITTKKGQAGVPKVEFSMSVGTSKIAKKLKVLSGDEYRTALGQFGLSPTGRDFGANTDALGAITRRGSTQNYNVALSSGTDNARYRVSLGYLDQQGIIRKTDFKKYSASLNSSFKMLNNKKLALDFNIATTHQAENIAPISNKGGSKGSLIGQALQWNPTRSLYKPGSDSLFIQYGDAIINPLAYSNAYNDNSKVTTILANLAPSYKFNDHWELKSQMSINYSTGIRRQYTTGYINIDNIAFVIDPVTGISRGGDASIGQNELITKQITNTLAFNKELNKNVYLNAVVGYEYQNINFSSNSQYGNKIIIAEGQPYYNGIGTSPTGSRILKSDKNPTEELQSFFGRAIFNIKDKYLLTGTLRADGSSKFGSANRYGYFPSVALGWNISNENFMKDVSQISNVKLRASYGQTGNQNYPAGVAQTTFRLDYNLNPATYSQFTNLNPELGWETTTTTNLGLEFAILKGRVNVVVDYFNRNTKDILFARDAAAPGPTSSQRWVNLDDARIINKGIELAINSNLIQKKDFSLGLNINATFLKNKFTTFNAEIPTGDVNGPGLSGAFAQLIKEGYPLNTFYLKQFTGVDKTSGVSSYDGGTDNKFLLGSANPTTLLGFTINSAYKKFTLEVSMNGAFGHYVYNNTANAFLDLNKLGTRNISKKTYDYALANGEKTINPSAASSRYLEKGDYLRLANLTLGYNVGSIGKAIRSSNIFITAQNLFVITKFSGFDPEVNVDKSLNNIPTFGMEYTPYPSARTINFGINFSL
jgi:TonB-dependent starch-binding outer membrane protein SusC